MQRHLLCLVNQFLSLYRGSVEEEDVLGIEVGPEPPGVAYARSIPDYALAGVARSGGGCGQGCGIRGGRGAGSHGGRGCGGGQGGSGGARRGGVEEEEEVYGGGRGCRKSYSTVEIEHLLGLLEPHIPIGPNEWDFVASKQNERFPDKERNKLSLRRQFQKLYKKKAPTGDPHVPPMVLDAKRIQHLIEERADSTGLDEPKDFGFAEGVPPDMSAAEADAQQSAVAATRNVRPVINVGGRSNNGNASLSDIMQLMVMCSDEERVEHVARAEAECEECRECQDEHDCWMQ